MASSYRGAQLMYILGAGANGGMPAGSNNSNAFMLGIASQHLTATGMPRRGVAVYSNLSAVAGVFQNRLTAPGAIATPAGVGPSPAFIPNRNGSTVTSTLPY